MRNKYYHIIKIIFDSFDGMKLKELNIHFTYNKKYPTMYFLLEKN